MTVVLSPTRWRAIGTYVELTTLEPDAQRDATILATGLLDRLDRSASRFRPDSDLCRANARAGRWVRVDPFLVAAVDAARSAAEASGGLVCPLLGRALVDLGYDRTFSDLGPVTIPGTRRGVDPQAWRQLETDASGAVRVPSGHSLDLGSSAKAWIADVIVGSIAEAIGTGSIVSVGGDVAVAGDPRSPGDDRWPVGISEHPDAEPQARVTIGPGGLATSSTVVRRWVADGAWVHHLIDPRTGRPTQGCWRTVTATGPTCLAANTATTAALVLGADALAWLEVRGVAARLVDVQGTPAWTAAWPGGDDRV